MLCQRLTFSQPQIPLTVHNRAVLTLGKEIEGLKKERDRAQLKSDAIVKDFKVGRF